MRGNGTTDGTASVIMIAASYHYYLKPNKLTMSCPQAEVPKATRILHTYLVIARSCILREARHLTLSVCPAAPVGHTSRFAVCTLSTRHSLADNVACQTRRFTQQRQYCQNNGSQWGCERGGVPRHCCAEKVKR